MIIEDINLLHKIEQPITTPFHYCRALEIVTDNGNIYTPYKTTNRPEFLARSGVPLLKTLPQNITSDFRLLDQKTIDGIFHASSNVGKKVLGTIKQFNDMTRGSKLRMTIFQPAEVILRNWSISKKINFADTQAEYLQAKLGLDLITYPFLNLPTSDYIEFIDKRYRGSETQSTIFTLDMAMEPNRLKSIIEHLVNKKEPIIIALIYKKWEISIPQHIIINDYFNNPKVVFMACQVDRIDEATNTSNTHAVAVGANFDIVALKQQRGYGKPTLETNKINFFAPQTLQINNFDNTFQQQQNLISEMRLTADDYLDLKHVSRILNGRNGAKVHPKKYLTLFYLSRVHEALTSADTFSKQRDAILDRNVRTYILQTSLQHTPMVKSPTAL